MNTLLNAACRRSKKHGVVEKSPFIFVHISRPVSFTHPQHNRPMRRPKKAMQKKTKLAALSSSSSTSLSSTSSVPTDAQLTTAILALTQKRGPTKTICPSEVPRMLCPSAWRACMPRMRAVAVHLSKQGRIDITQKGQVVMVEKEEDLRGPIRLRGKKDCDGGPKAERVLET